MTAGPRLCLVLGGARSGKSRHAEALALRRCDRPLYIATAEAGDREMRQRIAEHRRRRGPRWRDVEEPLALAPLLERLGPDDLALIDCLTVWLGNLMVHGRDVERACADLAAAAAGTRGRLILVANEVGLAPAPDNAMARDFTRHAGSLNRRLAVAADQVTLLLAGCPVDLKPRPRCGR